MAVPAVQTWVIFDSGIFGPQRLGRLQVGRLFPSLFAARSKAS
jgi:hypothetical protein